MGRCEVCGNDYDKAFEVVSAGARHVFDSFECAIQRMAPVCEHCGCRVIGHGAEVDGRFFCCAHCARQAVTTDAVRDRADTTPPAQAATNGRLTRGVGPCQEANAALSRSTPLRPRRSDQREQEGSPWPSS